MAEEWYYLLDGEKRGPVSGVELKRLAAAGKLLPDDKVKKEGISEWLPASQVKGLFPDLHQKVRGGADSAGKTAKTVSKVAKATGKISDAVSDVAEAGDKLQKAVTTVAGIAAGGSTLAGSVGDFLRPLGPINLVVFAAALASGGGLFLVARQKPQAGAKFRLKLAAVASLAVAAIFGLWAGLGAVAGKGDKGVLASNVKPVERLQASVVPERTRPQPQPKDPPPVKVNPVVLVKTTVGDIRIELLADKAPKTVANFLAYVDEGFYDGTIFHRVVPNFTVQGGGFEPGLIEKKTPRPLVPSESDNGLSNTAGTVAMARAGGPDTATSQFFINVNDNSRFLDRANAKDKVGYCVFGRVIGGMDVVDKIKAVRTANRNGQPNVPVEDVKILSVRRQEPGKEPTPVKRQEPTPVKQNRFVLVKTTMGDIRIELYPDKAPKTVANFLAYVDEGFYDGTIFHRVVPNFTVQGGGFEPGLIEKKTPRPLVPSESDNGLSNTAGTVAMARAGGADTATSQFFINPNDNSRFLDRANAKDKVGYCVFGRVIGGMDVVDTIKGVRTANRKNHSNVPVEDVKIISIRRE